MKYQDKNADEIISNKFINHSSWHFFQSKSWLDLAKRTLQVSPLHYSAFELRYGIEYLFFELLVLTNKKLTESDYKKCLGSPQKMDKMLKNHERPYKKLARFTEIANSLILNKPKFLYWDLSELFRYWGIASELLHFVGAHIRTYESEGWIISSIGRIETTVDTIWNKITNNLGVALYNPDLMIPPVKDIWLDYLNNKINDDSVRTRLFLIKPL